MRDNPSLDLESVGVVKKEIAVDGELNTHIISYTGLCWMI